MSLDIPASDPPVAIDLDRATGLRIEWPDGAISTFALETLRANCPCAQCRGERERGIAPWPRGALAGDELRAAGAELVGNWGLQITWHDGHSTGIYAWGILRAWAGLDITGSESGESGHAEPGSGDSGTQRGEAAEGDTTTDHR